MPGPREPEKVVAFESYCEDELNGTAVFDGVNYGIVCESPEIDLEGTLEYNDFYVGTDVNGSNTVVPKTTYENWQDKGLIDEVFENIKHEGFTGIVLRQQSRNRDWESELRELENKTGHSTFWVDWETGDVMKW